MNGIMKNHKTIWLWITKFIHMIIEQNSVFDSKVEVAQRISSAFLHHVHFYSSQVTTKEWKMIICFPSYFMAITTWREGASIAVIHREIPLAPYMMKYTFWGYGVSKRFFTFQIDKISECSFTVAVAIIFTLWQWQYINITRTRNSKLWLYGIHTLWFEFDNDIFTGFKMPRL